MIRVNCRSSRFLFCLDDTPFFFIFSFTLTHLFLFVFKHRAGHGAPRENAQVSERPKVPARSACLFGGQSQEHVGRARGASRAGAGSGGYGEKEGKRAGAGAAVCDLEFGSRSTRRRGWIHITCSLLLLLSWRLAWFVPFIILLAKL